MKFLRRKSCLLIMFSAAIASAETWHADPISGCTVFDDAESPENVLVSWSGDCDSKNRASGSGVLIWVEDGKLAGRYEGTMEGGKADGRGVIYVVADEGGFDLGDYSSIHKWFAAIEAQPGYEGMDD